jgi:hypothetical protein
MYRIYVYLAALVSITTMSVTAFAEPTVAPVTTVSQSRNASAAPNEAGFYIDLPAVSPDQLVNLLRAYRASLIHQEEVLTHYLDEHKLTAKDTLLTVILPGGLLYAAIRTGDLEQAKAELAEVTDALAELARDLLAMRAIAGDLTVAQLER